MLLITLCLARLISEKFKYIFKYILTGVISDDLSKDCFAVDVFTERVLQYLKQNGLVKEVKKLIRFSDNCLSQYKSRYSFGLMSRKPYPVVYEYFCPMHGKYIYERLECL